MFTKAFYQSQRVCSARLLRLILILSSHLRLLPTDEDTNYHNLLQFLKKYRNIKCLILIKVGIVDSIMNNIGVPLLPTDEEKYCYRVINTV